MKQPDITYVVSAFRYGYANHHQYCVASTNSLKLARATAQKESAFRAGKYAIIITKFKDGKGVKDICYIPSGLKEDKLRFDAAEFAWRNLFGAELYTALHANADKVANLKIPTKMGALWLKSLAAAEEHIARHVDKNAS